MGRSYLARLAVTFGGGLAADLIGIGWYRAFNQDAVLIAALLAFVSAYAGLLVGVVADEKTWGGRIGLVTATGLAGSVGTVVIMTLWP